MDKQNIGNAGEYYIASRLSALDCVATITLGRAEKYDILMLNPKGKLFKLSVKTTQFETAKNFLLSSKDEECHYDDFYYVFIKLNNFKKEPDFWIIPSKVVCPLLKTSEEIWLKIPAKGNRQRNPSTMRKLPIEVKESEKLLYPKSWDIEVNKYYKNLDQLL